MEEDFRAVAGLNSFTYGKMDVIHPIWYVRLWTLRRVRSKIVVDSVEFAPEEEVGAAVQAPLLLHQKKHATQIHVCVCVCCDASAACVSERERERGSLSVCVCLLC